ncbi:peptidoglycan-binding domain-containing protein [Aureimonas pseudogalii]|uniref:Peptidoglycan hydrolase-like protein with peptidoglycan-binding domain n=1 Tax=Aureimonas pseudogalii TaxID=1744844 RepID=A0A7W6H376_9HYPH|nr:peptidoglycan-binding protein [Aureimonas pseudogalii]MBB3996588.1 peptidoglycan hydrolase-like protein with peptidoglycan-binding domain [Aureimonas pseudogalii]
MARALLRGVAGGLVAGGRVLAARPVFFGSVAVFAALSGVVADNALNRQTGRHPHPMLATRPDEVAAILARPAAARRAAPEKVEIANDPRILAFPLVREVQTLLAERGLYTSGIDGRAGQATDLAIRAFQNERGLRVDGMATPLLLSQIRAANEPPGAPPRDEIASLVNVDPGATAGIGSDAELVREIQAKLSEAQVADITADGILGERTRAAIRTFQALESLEVTGEPTREVLARLEAVSAGR